MLTGNPFWWPSSNEASKFKIQISSKSIFWRFKKFKKNIEIHEGITHICVNFQGKIRWNEGCAKNTNLGLFNTWYYLSSQAINLSFLYRSQLKVFHHEFFTHMWVTSLHACIIFLDFLKHKSLNLKFSKIMGSMELGLQNAIFNADMLRTTLTCISKDRDAIFFSSSGFLVLLNPLNMEHVALL